MGIFDVPPAELIKEVAKDLKQKLEKPKWIDFVKSGSSKERAPQSRDFWFDRNASILFRVYKNGPIGTESLRSYYGGRKNRGVKPEHHRKASGKIIRLCLQTLEKKGFIKKEKKGRVITSTGEKYLYGISKIVQKNIETMPVEQRKPKQIEQLESKAKHGMHGMRGADKRDRHKDEKKEKAEKK